ncbi:hypothetical protein H6G36_26410 [Anabaena minutissima FACHB-250]|nr:hypothetical protein [Anabaena minutissima FACHB-250]
MITQEKFDKGIALLQTHFNRELCKSAIAIWSEYLNEHLDDESFTIAVKQAILSLDFFPNAKRLVEFAFASKEVRAIADWQIVIAAAKTGNEEYQKQILQSLTPQGHATLAYVGGIEVIALANDWKLDKLEKKFVSVYCDSPTGVRFLPPAPTSSNESSQANVVNFPVKREPIDPTQKPPSVRRVLEKINLLAQGEVIPTQEIYAGMFARYAWQIDERRLNFFLAMDEETKQQVLAKFKFAMKTKSNWHSPQGIFDDITSYQPPVSPIDVKAIAHQWLAEESQSQAQEIEF